MDMNEELKLVLVDEDYCPMCLGELDTEWECGDCGYDAIKEAIRNAENLGKKK